MRLPRRRRPVTARPAISAGIHRAQHEGVGEPEALEARAADARGQRFEVDGDVGQLGHGRIAPV